MGPILGSLFYQLTNFRMTMNAMALIVVIHTTVYVLTAQGCQALTQTCKNFRERNMPEKRSTEESLVASRMAHRVHSAFFYSTVSVSSNAGGSFS